MKKARKLLAFVLAMMMMLAMGMSAMAAETGSITIKTSENGTTYNLYRVFDLSGQDTNSETAGYEAVTYSKNNKWGAFVDGYLVATNTGELSPISVDGTTKYINITEDNIVAFTNAAMKEATTKNIAADATITGNGSDVTVTDLALGYYLVVPVNAIVQNSNSSGSTASISSTVPNADVSVKAVKPTIDKTDDKVSADIGATVTYTITGVIPNVKGYEYEYTYEIEDQMSDGLTFQKDVSFKIEGVDSGDITYDYDNVTNGFKARINVGNLMPSQSGKTFTLTYTAIVNDNAVNDDGAAEKNTVKLSYGNNPSETTVVKSEEVYSSKIIVDKWAVSSDTKLAGAKFVLMNSEGKYYKYTAADRNNVAKVEWVTVADAPTSGTANVTSAQATTISNAVKGNTITGVITDESGAAVFNGLADGTYYLVEYEAPAGYNRLDKPHATTVAGRDVDTGEGKIENQADSTGSFDNANHATASIENKTGDVLPSTGGIGTTMFYVIGGALVAVAVVLLVTRKRMSVEK